MPRAPRIQYPGALYHVMSRGVKGATIFEDRLDYELFLATLAEAVERTGWRIHAFALLPNHIHVLTETPQPNLVAGMKWMLGAFAQRFNARHGQRGHVFQGRYKALPIETEEGGYFERVSTYIHLNPIRAGLTREETGGPCGYVWSSLPLFLVPGRKRPPWLVVERVLGNLELGDNAGGRREYRRFIEERAGELGTRKGKDALNGDWQPIRRGWYLGSDAFRRKLMGRVGNAMEGGSRESYSGDAVRQHDEREAERLVTTGMRIVGLAGADLGELAKGDLRKCAAAWLVHSRTTAGHRWIATRLHMGCPSNMTVYIDRVRKATSGPGATLRKRLTSAIQEQED